MKKETSQFATRVCGKAGIEVGEEAARELTRLDVISGDDPQRGARLVSRSIEGKRNLGFRRGETRVIF